MKRVIPLVLSLLFPVVCAAQDVRLPRVEFGAQIAVLGTITLDGFHPLFSVGPRMSVRLTQRLAIDFLAETVKPDEDAGVGIYQIQARQTLKRIAAGRGEVFLAGGVFGLIRDWNVPEYRYSGPDGTVVVSPARTGVEMQRPIAFAGGFGVQRPFARYAAIRLDAQAIVGFEGWWLVRGSLGVAVPIGRYR